MTVTPGCDCVNCDRSCNAVVPRERAEPRKLSRSEQLRRLRDLKATIEDTDMPDDALEQALLSHLREHAPVTLMELADALDYDAQAVSRELALLFRREAVVLAPDGLRYQLPGGEA